MTILSQLSSQCGDRTERSNERVAAACLADPALLAEVAGGLRSPDAKLLGDAAEVMTKVAEQRPELIVPHEAALAQLLSHRTTRVRWEAVHALALAAPLIPDTVARLLPWLQKAIAEDSSTIVRDYAVEMIGGYAGTSAKAARRALPLLKDALLAWEGKHAARVLRGLGRAAAAEPALAAEVRPLGEGFVADQRGTVRNTALTLLKALK